MYSVKAYRGSGSVDPLILDLDGGELLTSHPGYCTARKEPLYPLNRRLGGPQRQYRRFGKEKNVLPLPGFEPWTVHPPA